MSIGSPGTPWDCGGLLARHLAAVAHAATMAEASAELAGPDSPADEPATYATSLADVHAAVHGLLWLQRGATQPQAEREVIDAAERRWRVTSIRLPGVPPVDRASAWYSVAFVRLPKADNTADGDEVDAADGCVVAVTVSGDDPASAAGPDLAALLNQALVRRRFIAARLSSPTPAPEASPGSADALTRRGTPRALWLVR